MPRKRYLGQLDPVLLQLPQVRQRRVLLSIHEHLRARQPEERGHQVPVVRQVDHGLEDAAHGAGTHFLRQRRGVQRGGVVGRAAGALDEVFEEGGWVRVVVRDDLAREEAVFGGDVAFDVGEGEDAGWLGGGEEEGGEAAHGVAGQVKRRDGEVREHGLRGVDEEGDGNGGKVGAVRGAAAGGVVGQEGAAGEGGVVDEVDVVFFGGAEAMEEED